MQAIRVLALQGHAWFKAACMCTSTDDYITFQAYSRQNLKVTTCVVCTMTMTCNCNICTNNYYYYALASEHFQNCGGQDHIFVHYVCSTIAYVYPFYEKWGKGGMAPSMAPLVLTPMLWKLVASGNEQYFRCMISVSGFCVPEFEEGPAWLSTSLI